MGRKRRIEPGENKGDKHVKTDGKQGELCVQNIHAKRRTVRDRQTERERETEREARARVGENNGGKHGHSHKHPERTAT